MFCMIVVFTTARDIFTHCLLEKEIIFVEGVTIKYKVPYLLDEQGRKDEKTERWKDKMGGGFCDLHQPVLLFFLASVNFLSFPCASRILP